MKKRVIKELSKNRKILFVAALQAELKTIKEIYSLQPEHIQADFFVSGVGCLETSMRLTQKLSEENYDFIINIGICGYKKIKQDIIQIARSIYLPNEKEIVIPQFVKLATRVSIACSEVPVYKSNILGEENYVDMESYAIEKVSEHFRIPRLILKIPYDKIGKETRNFRPSEAQAYFKNTLCGVNIYTPILKYFSTLSQKRDISKYLSHYSFTVSETIIFEKYFYGYITLAAESFEVFFNAHKGLEKKAFLKELKTACIELKKL